MNTLFDLRVRCEERRAGAARDTLRDIHAGIRTLEEELSEFLPASPVARLNTASPGERVAAPPVLWELFQMAERLRETTGGAFDATAKGTGAISADFPTRTLWRESPGARLGFGAIGKGFAIDRVRERVERDGFEHYLLNAGGSSLALRGSAGDGPWRWAWSWEKGARSGVSFVHDSQQAVAIGVSGDEEQPGHIRRARPAGLRSALVALAGAAEADALSTALFAAGWEDASPFLRETASAGIGHDGFPVWNGLFQKYWGGVPTLSPSSGEETS